MTSQRAKLLFGNRVLIFLIAMTFITSCSSKRDVYKESEGPERQESYETSVIR